MKTQQLFNQINKTLQLVLIKKYKTVAIAIKKSVATDEAFNYPIVSVMNPFLNQNSIQ